MLIHFGRVNIIKYNLFSRTAMLQIITKQIQLMLVHNFVVHSSEEVFKTIHTKKKQDIINSYL